ncbi:hypothetical protein N9X04_00190 [bacterium]|nr:hypothetical protein [bacterium]
MVKRPPTNYKKNIGDSDPGANLFTHFVKRDETNKYCVTVSLGNSVSIGQVGVIDLETGNKVSVAVTSIATSYLSGISNPLSDIRALTVADYTFLVNKKKTVQKDTTTLSQVPDDEAIVFVKLGDYEKSYSIYIDEGLVPHAASLHNHHDYNTTGHAPSTYISGPSTGTHAGKHADTELIAKDLAACLTEEFDGTLLGVSEVDVTFGGSGYLGGGLLANRQDYKLEVEVSQAGVDETALGVGTVNTSGEIVSVEMVRFGNNFNASNPFIYTVKEYSNLGTEWRQIISPLGSGATFSETTTTRSSLEVTIKGSVIRIKSSDGPFKIRVEDGLSNEALGLAYQEVGSITDLPRSCFNNFTVKVIGDADIDQDDYFVRFTTKDKSEFGEGAWVETVGWTRDESESGLLTAIETDLDAATMPVTLVPILNGSGNISSFKLQTPGEDLNPTPPAENGWRSRQAGNDATNPFPSFVGNTINDVFFFKNRLGFLTDSNVIFSEADEYFNFFRTTTQQLLDSALIDVGLSHTKVAVLQHAVPFQEKLMLFSKQSQFVLRGADILSPKTVAISPVTEYDISDSVQPIALGNYIYFTFRRNDFEGMYEYFVDNNTETFNSEEITSQIPKYITSNVQKIAGSQAENTIVLNTSADPKTLFVYKYFWSNKEKIQSAWMKFTFERDVRGFDFIDSNLHLLTSDTEGLHLESLTLEDGLKDTDLDYTLYLDSRVDGAANDIVVSLYNPATKVTRVSGIPYDTTSVEIYTKLGNERAITVVDSSTVDVNGPLASYASHNSVVYKCKVNHTSSSTTEPGVGADWADYWDVSTDFSTANAWVTSRFYNNDQYFFVGKPYNMLYRFSDQTLKQPTERGGRSSSDYAYQTIRNGSINYADTGHFTVEVTPKFRDKYSYAFNPDIVGANLTLNAFTPQNGHFRFPVQAQPEEATIEVKSASALPVKLLGAEFESMFIPRSRRYGA